MWRNATCCLSQKRKQESRPAMYTLHNQTLERVTEAKYLGVNLIEILYWGKQVTATVAKANTVSAFISQEPNGMSHRCPGSLLVLERFSPSSPGLHTSVVWDPHQQHLRSTLGMVQQHRSACRFLHDFSPRSSASALVAQLGLNSPQSLSRTRRRKDMACLMYKIMQGLVLLSM